jgi:hypothetical protein
VGAKLATTGGIPAILIPVPFTAKFTVAANELV